MIINENLILDTKFKNPKYWVSADNYKFENGIATMFIQPNNLGLGIIFELREELEKDINYKFSALVKTDKSLGLDYNYFIGQPNKRINNGKSLIPNKWQKVTLDFKLNDDFVTNKIMVGSQYKDNFTATIKIKQPKFEVEKESIYIPNVNDLEPSEQAVFVAGGTFKEVYPI